jgi:hypothetical protein
LTENHKRCPMCTTPVLDTLTTGSNDAEWLMQAGDTIVCVFVTTF